jgi:hypothetical protein
MCRRLVALSALPRCDVSLGGKWGRVWIRVGNSKWVCRSRNPLVDLGTAMPNDVASGNIRSKRRTDTHVFGNCRFKQLKYLQMKCLQRLVQLYIGTSNSRDAH